jgi:hypothetical protein
MVLAKLMDKCSWLFANAAGIQSVIPEIIKAIKNNGKTISTTIQDNKNRKRRMMDLLNG